MRKITEVVAALIWDGDAFMICQRPAHKARGLLWEFVGGKVEPGETKEAALIRECREELAVELHVGTVFMDVLHEYPDLTVHLTLFNATIASGTPQKLEHNDIQWITPDQIPHYDFCPADVEILARIIETQHSEKIAVIDTETTWDNRVMSIGTVIADGRTFRALGGKYHVLTPEYQAGGMFSDALFLEDIPKICSRAEALAEIKAWLISQGVRRIFAYNAGFDRGHLTELHGFQWYDIMRLAAYRQTNPAIPATADCCSTGRLKRGYGVEAMLRLLRCDQGYRETHNALGDALDELEILRLLGHPIETYIELK